MIEWSPQQSNALESIRSWIERGDSSQPVFRLFGYAGTGKSTLAEHMKDYVDDVRYATLTGKAAVVLRRKGCESAQTIHSMIYRGGDKSREDFDRVTSTIMRAQASNEPQHVIDGLERELAKLKRDLANPIWMLNEHAFDRYWDEERECYMYTKPPDLICIDECSMVDKRIGEDLLSFGIPILVLGDPAQLPPVAGGGFFTSQEPDVLLTEIHRQAEGNPIIQIASDIRRGKGLVPGTYGESRIVDREEVSPDEWMSADQILVGKNVTRKRYNARYRERLGYQGILPRPGERLVCLRNEHDKGLLNGSLWEVIEAQEPDNSNLFLLSLKSLDGITAGTVVTRAHKKPFLGLEWDDPWERRDASEFEFGYALTVHKSQGSQWDNVILVDEWPRSDSRKEWRYTGVTRAAQKVTVVT